jgi:S1-C subfamily serine protease
MSPLEEAMTNHEATQAISDGLAAAVAVAAASVVTVDARRRIAASGIAWSDDTVLTANHVVERDDITIRNADGTELTATLAGRDPGTDCAVLRVSGGTLTPAVRASSPAKVGHLVLALGRPETDIRASLGIINRVGGAWRTFRGGTVEGFLQAGVEMLPGFSGGPLINAAGESLAMNSSQLGRGSGMAIPLAALAPIVEQLLSQGRIRRAYLGIGTQAAALPQALSAKVGGQAAGLLITSVEPASPADKGGLLMGDILVKLAGSVVDGADSLQAQLGGDRVGVATPATVLRGGETLDLTVTPGERGG